MHEVISVIIPTYNSELTIEECLSSIFSNKNSPPFEVIVVDGGSIDGTLDIVKNYPVKVLFTDKPQSNQRNVGIRNAAGDIVAFTDSDCRVTDIWLSTLIKRFDDLTIASVGGPNLTSESDPFLARCFGALMESPLGSAGVRNTVLYNKIREVNHNPPVNSAVRKSVLQEVGGFEDEFVTSEDVILDAKITKKGGKLVYDPAMLVWHHRRRTLKGFIKQILGYGRGRASAFLKYPNSLPVTYFCVVAFTLGTVLSIPLYTLVKFLRPIIMYGWIAYLLFIFLFSFYIAIKKSKPVFAAILPPLAFIEHFSLGLGFIIGLTRPYTKKTK